MADVTIELRSIHGTEAALGCAGGHTVVIDRPEGRAGGQGLGFNGAQLLGLALGGCYCNDLRYAAHELGVELGEIAVSVTIELGGEPLVATAARLAVRCTTAVGGQASEVIEQARAHCTVANTLTRGLAVSFGSASSEC